MKKILIIGAIVAILIAGVTIVTAANNEEPMGPAPNAGDGNPDGSGFDSPNGQMNGPGPAPNSGDGIPDGPGWE